MPIDHEKKKIDILANKFNSINAPYKKLFFDKNRNMLDPNFVIVGLEIGSQNKYFEKQLEIIKKFINKNTMFDYQWPSAYTIKPDFVRSKINHNSFKYLKEIEHFFRKNFNTK